MKIWVIIQQKKTLLCTWEWKSTCPTRSFTYHFFRVWEYLLILMKLIILEIHLLIKKEEPREGSWWEKPGWEMLGSCNKLPTNTEPLNIYSHHTVLTLRSTRTQTPLYRPHRLVCMIHPDRGHEWRNFMSAPSLKSPKSTEAKWSK